MSKQIEDLTDRSYGRAIERKTTGERYRIRVAGFAEGLVAAFDTWVDQHPDAEILDVRYAIAPCYVKYCPLYGNNTGVMLVVYRDREDAPAGAGEEG